MFRNIWSIGGSGFRPFEMLSSEVWMTMLSGSGPRHSDIRRRPFALGLAGLVLELLALLADPG